MNIYRLRSKCNQPPNTLPVTAYPPIHPHTPACCLVISPQTATNSSWGHPPTRLTHQPSHPPTHPLSKPPVHDDNHIHREPEGCIAPYGPHGSGDGSDAPDSEPSSTNTGTCWSGWVMTGVVLCFISCGSCGARPARAAAVRLYYESITSPHATPKSSFRGHPVTFHTT